VKPLAASPTAFARLADSALVCIGGVKSRLHSFTGVVSVIACLQQLRITQPDELDDGQWGSDLRSYCCLAYSTMASFRMGMSVSAFFQVCGSPGRWFSAGSEILDHPHVAIELLPKNGQTPPIRGRNAPGEVHGFLLP
jgi:hypothetical protein